MLLELLDHEKKYIWCDHPSVHLARLYNITTFFLTPSFSLAVITNGIYADLGTAPDSDQLAMGTWYRSKDTLGGDYPFTQNLLNKKWPLAKGIGFQIITITLLPYHIITLLFHLRSLK